MRRLLSALALNGIALTCVYAQNTLLPCNAGSALNGTILPVINDRITYCVSDYGWSDAWLKGNPAGRYNPQDDVLSGDDAFNLKYVGGIHGQSTGWLSPTLDQGTLGAQPAPGPTYWTIKAGTHYTHFPLVTATQSIISNSDGLEITIDTFAPPGQLGVQIALTIKNVTDTTTKTTFTQLQLADYFNFHPLGSLHPSPTNPNSAAGTTSLIKGCIVTSAPDPTILEQPGMMCGERAPDKFEIGYAVGGLPIVWEDVGANAYNRLDVAVGPADSAGAMQWELGTLAPGQSVRFAVSKNATIAIPPVLMKTFAPNSISVVNGASVLTFNLTNPNPFQLTNVAFTDTLPNTVTATTLGKSLVCGGTLTVSAALITLGGAALAPLVGTCSFSVTVTGSLVGTYVNTTSVVTSSEAPDGKRAIDTLTVTPPPLPPVITKVFVPAMIPVGLNSVLSFTITNPNATTLTSVGFNDTLPPGLFVATSNGLTGTCGGVPIGAPPGGNTISVNGAMLPPGCAFSVNVTSSVAGVYVNNTGPVTSKEGGPGPSATSTLTVVAPPIITKVFNPLSILVNGTSILSFTITNPNMTAQLTGVGFTDTLPANVTVTTPNNGLMGTCFGTAPVAGGSTITLSGATVPPGLSCTFSITVTSAIGGVYKNLTTAVTSIEGGSGNVAMSTLTVVKTTLSISKSFTPPSIPLKGTSVLSFTITNSPGGIPLTGIAFTDPLPGNVFVSNPTVINMVVPCGAGAISAPAGGNTITLTGGALATGTSCTFSVNVTSAVAGVYVNTTSNVTSDQGVTGLPATSILTVVPAPPVITKAFNPISIPVNGISVLTFTITNPNPNVQLTVVGFNDTLPALLFVSNPNGLTGTCGGGAISASGSTITLMNAVLPAAGVCTFSVNVTSAIANTYTNITSPVTSLEGGPGNMATSTLIVGDVIPPVLTKGFGAVSIGLNSTTTMTFILTNPLKNPTLTNVTFTDPLPSGLRLANTVGLSGTCDPGILTAPGTVTANPGDTFLKLSNATFAPGASCTFTMNITGVMPGLQVNTTTVVTSLQAPPGDPATATIFVGSPYQLTYDANLDKGDSVLDVTNNGATGAGLASGTTASVTGSICANVYVFSPDEQLVSCCSCPVTPNGLVSLSANNDLISNTLTPLTPTSIVVKILASLPVGNSCTSSAASVTPLLLANGLTAFNQTLHMTPNGTFAPTEKPFSGGTLSAGELNRLTSLCNFILSNGSGFGVCKACRLGGLGADHQ